MPLSNSIKNEKYLSAARLSARALSLFLCLCLCLSLFLTSGCSKRSELIRAPLLYVPSCLDPQLACGSELENILNNCLEGLVRIDPSGNTVYAVAENHSVSADGLTYSFSLDKKARYRLQINNSDTSLADGFCADSFDTRVKAADFVFALRRAVDPKTASPYAKSFACIAGADKIIRGEAPPDSLAVFAPDDGTLVIRLCAKNPAFLSLLASPAALPCSEEFFKAAGGRYGLSPSLLLCNGPYYLKSLDGEKGAVLCKNERYTGNFKASADSLRFIPAEAYIKNEGEPCPDIPELMLLKEGGYDLCFIRGDKVKELEGTADIKRLHNTTKLLCFNAASRAMNNARLRKALMLSTDSSLLRSENSVAAKSLVPKSVLLTPDSPYRSEPYTAIPAFSLESSEKLLKESGFEGSLNIRLVCLREDEALIKAMLQNWQKVFGVHLSVELKSFSVSGELEKALKSGDFDIAFTSFRSPCAFSSGFLNSFASGSDANFIGLNSREYDALLCNIFKASGTRELQEACAAAENFLLSGSYLLPVCEEDSFLAVRKGLNGIHTDPSGCVLSFFNF